ncbi:reverse transcriptase domain-containing protein [Tanacetum coccineum]
MSAVANATPILATVTKNANNEKAPDVASRVNILDFCEEHYEDILPIIMEKARRDKRKEVQTRLNFGENPKKTRRERENSLNSRAENSPTRFHPGIPRTRGREKRDDRNVFNRLSHRRKSVHERLSDTYSPSATKSGPSRTDSRDPSHSGGYSLSREHPRIKDRLWGVEESYGDTYSRGTRTKYRDRSRDEDRFRSVKRWRESESPSSESSTSNGGHWKSRTKRRNLVDEDDLAVPWTCEDVDPFTPRIRNFKSSRKTRMPNNVKTYDGTGDPEDHLKIFQAAAQVERWAMPTWCHMFNSTLIGAARVWFDELPPESIDGYKGLKAAFLAYFMQQKKYVKDPVEIHNIKQRDGETIEDFMERFKVETGRMKGAPECMRISGFMHGVNNPELTKRLNEHVPKTMEEMMTVTTAFIRGEAAAASKKKGHLPWKSQDQSKRHASERRSDFRENDRQKLTQSFAHGSEITFPPLANSDGTEGPLVIEAEIGGHMIHRIYIDGGSSTEILYEHCFNQLQPEIKNQMVPATTSLTGFSGETIWPLGQLRLLVTIRDAYHSTKAWMNFMIVISLSPYNGIIGRPGIREIQAIPFTAHGMLKFPTNGGIVTIRSTILIPVECTTVITSSKEVPKEAEVHPKNFKIALHPNFPDQEVAIGGTLSIEGRTELCSLLKKNLDIFAWKLSDMTRVPRSVAEHRLNIREGYSPVREKKMVQALERSKAIQAEVQKLVEAGMMREVYYHYWLSNPVMVKKHDGSWRMCVDFTDLNKACPQDCYPLPKIDWKVESLYGYSFKCFLDAYKGYHQIQMAESDEEKRPFIPAKRLVDKAFDSQVGQNMEVYGDDLVIKSHTKEEMIRDINETFWTLRRINMKLKPKKCTFGAREGMFLGYMISPEGIKSCPEKTEVVLQLPSSRTIKEIQSLNGKLASLNRFLSKSAEKSLPLFKTLKKCIKNSDFHWTPEAEQAFTQLKQHLSELPLLVAPKPKEVLIVYLAASQGAISEVLMTERDTVQTPVYFVSRALQGPELKYSPMEKLVLSLVFTAKRLRMYFQAHPIAVITDQPIKQIMSYFLVEKPDENLPETPATDIPQEPWTLFMDGSSCIDGSGAGADGSTQCARKLRIKARQYELLEGILYKRSFLKPWLRNPQHPLTPITAPWPFYKWGIDIAGPFPEGSGKVKFLIVTMDYFTKWIEAKAVVTITRNQELPHVLWAHRTMIKSSHGDTPFSLTYGTEAVILAEIGMPTYRTSAVDTVHNDEELRLNLDLLEEKQERAAICEAKAKIKMTKYYNARVRGVAFRPRDFVYHSNDASHVAAGGKLGPKWEGPYEVTEALGDGAYKLRTMGGADLPRTWNVANLKKCYL